MARASSWRIHMGPSSSMGLSSRGTGAHSQLDSCYVLLAQFLCPQLTKYKHDKHFAQLCIGRSPVRNVFWCNVFSIDGGTHLALSGNHHSISGFDAQRGGSRIYSGQRVLDLDQLPAGAEGGQREGVLQAQAGGLGSAVSVGVITCEV